MLGFGRQPSFGLAGWLWADLPLGLFAIFLAANTAVTPNVPQRAGVDPKPIELRIPVSGAALLSTDQGTVQREQARIATALAAQVLQVAPGRHVAIVFAYGVHASATDGDKMANVGSALLSQGPFSGSVVALAARDAGRSAARRAPRADVAARRTGRRWRCRRAGPSRDGRRPREEQPARSHERRTDGRRGGHGAPHGRADDRPEPRGHTG